MIAAVTTTAVDVVRRYLAAVADADATADDSPRCSTRTCASSSIPTW
jgi:hypothetical protein